MRRHQEKDEDERKALHGKSYVERFERDQSIRRIDRLVPLMGLRGGEKIVDIGCGNALALDALKGNFRSYTGLDFSVPFIEAAKSRARSMNLQNAEFYCESAQAFTERSVEKFDVALALDLSEHVYDEEWHLILSAIHNMLRVGGRLYIHTPNLDFFIELMKKNDFVLKQFPEHIAVRSMSENKELLTGAGFRLTAAHVLPHYNVLSVLHPLSRIPFIGKFFGARLFIEAVKPE